MNVGVLDKQILAISKFQIEIEKNVEPCWCFDKFERLLFTSGKSWPTYHHGKKWQNDLCLNCMVNPNFKDYIKVQVILAGSFLNI